MVANRVALIGDRDRNNEAHERIANLAGCLPVELEWLPTPEVGDVDLPRDFAGIWVIPGSPYANRDGVLTAIRHARENDIPYLGTCGGFQHALVEYVRNVGGIAGAEDVQYDPAAEIPLIVPLACSMAGERAALELVPGTRISTIFGGTTTVTETYHCGYGVDAELLDSVAVAPLVVSGTDRRKAPRVIELSSHRFFVATLFQPELSSTPGSVHPVIHAFVQAALDDRRPSRMDEHELALVRPGSRRSRTSS